MKTNEIGTPRHGTGRQLLQWGRLEKYLSCILNYPVERKESGKILSQAQALIVEIEFWWESSGAERANLENQWHVWVAKRY